MITVQGLILILVLLVRIFLFMKYKTYAAKNEISMVRMFDESLSRKSINSKNNLYIKMWHKYNSKDISPITVNILSTVLYFSKNFARSMHSTGVMTM